MLYKKNKPGPGPRFWIRFIESSPRKRPAFAANLNMEIQPVRRWRNFLQLQTNKISFDALNALFNASHLVNDISIDFSIYVRELCVWKMILFLEMSHHITIMCSLQFFFLGFRKWLSRTDRVVNLNTTIRFPLFWRTWTRALASTRAHMRAWFSWFLKNYRKNEGLERDISKAHAPDCYNICILFIFPVAPHRDWLSRRGKTTQNLSKYNSESAKTQKSAKIQRTAFQDNFSWFQWLDVEKREEINFEVKCVQTSGY